MDKPANRFYGEQRVEIKPGRYGDVKLYSIDHTPTSSRASIMCAGSFDKDELREISHFLNQLAEALERE